VSVAAVRAPEAEGPVTPSGLLAGRYRLDPRALHAAARSVAGLPPEQAFPKLVDALAAQYPIARDVPWIFNNAGGAMGQIKILYASPREYLLIFGTPIGTEGHSGRYRAEVWDFVVDGEMWCYQEGDLSRREFRPGDAAFLGGRQAKGYRIADRCWMLEYGRGAIPLMLPFGLADTVFSTLDLSVLARTLWHYTRLAVKSFFP
jgi:C-8 sterol isomerase